MYQIYFYKDSNGKEPVLDYIKELKEKDNKDSRIKLNKINDYIQVLKLYGVQAGAPYIKSLGDGLWELRPLRDRIIFIAWTENSYVLLHSFMKKTQKTPKREIEKAKQEYKRLIQGGA